MRHAEPVRENVGVVGEASRIRHGADLMADGERQTAGRRERVHGHARHPGRLGQRLEPEIGRDRDVRVVEPTAKRHDESLAEGSEQPDASADRSRRRVPSRAVHHQHLVEQQEREPGGHDGRAVELVHAPASHAPTRHDERGDHVLLRTAGQREIVEQLGHGASSPRMVRGAAGRGALPGGPSARLHKTVRGSAATSRLRASGARYCAGAGREGSPPGHSGCARPRSSR